MALYLARKEGTFFCQVKPSLPHLHNLLPLTSRDSTYLFLISSLYCFVWRVWHRCVLRAPANARQTYYRSPSVASPTRLSPNISTEHTTMGDFDDDDVDAMLAAEEAMEQEQMAMDAVRAFPPHSPFPPLNSTPSSPAHHTKLCPRNQPDVRGF